MHLKTLLATATLAALTYADATTTTLHASPKPTPKPTAGAKVMVERANGICHLSVSGLSGCNGRTQNKGGVGKVSHDGKKCEPTHDFNGDANDLICSQICDTAKICSYYKDGSVNHEIRNGDVFFYDQQSHYHVDSVGHIIGQGAEVQRDGKWKHVNS